MNKRSNEGEEIMTMKEALEYLGISRSTLNNRIKEGKITPLPKPPALRRAARLEFRREDVERLAQSS